MRSISVLLICLLLAGAARAEPKKTMQVVAAKPPAAAGLRGPQTLTQASTTPLTAPTTTPAPIQSPAPGLRLASASTPPVDLGQCRQACAHAYYFCLAGEAAGDCPGNWSSCLVDCGHPATPLP
jgi:hypothetical protein